MGRMTLKSMGCQLDLRGVVSQWLNICIRHVLHSINSTQCSAKANSPCVAETPTQWKNSLDRSRALLFQMLPSSSPLISKPYSWLQRTSSMGGTELVGDLGDYLLWCRYSATSAGSKRKSERKGVGRPTNQPTPIQGRDAEASGFTSAL